MSDYLTEGPTWTPEECNYARAVHTAACEMAAAMFRHAPGYCLALLGQTTVGKSMISRKLKEWWNLTARFAGNQVWKYEAATWIDWPNHTFQQVEDATRTNGLLILDEVGRGRVSAAASAAATDRLIDLLSIRENRSLFTVVTANWSAADVPDGALLERFRRNGSRCIEAPAKLRPFSRR